MAQWINWAGSLYAEPQELLKPTTLDELGGIVTANPGKTIRLAGTGHSWSPLVPTDSIIIDAKGIIKDGKKAWRWQQNADNFLTVTPAANNGDVWQALVEETPDKLPKMAFPTNGVVTDINLCGFVAAGCHGTGWSQPTVSDLVHSMDIMLHDGRIKTFTEGEASTEEMAAVRVNLGTLGIITSITFKLEEMFNIHAQDLLVKTENVMGGNPRNNNGKVDSANLQDLVENNEYVELFWFPWSGSGISHPFHLNEGYLWVKQDNRSTDAVRDVPNWPPMNPITIATMEYVAEQTPKDASGHLLVPGIEWTAWEVLKGLIEDVENTKGYVAEAPQVFHYQKEAFPVIDFSVAIPIEQASDGHWDFDPIVNAWYAVVNEVIDDYPNAVYPVTVSLHARFIKNSQAWLSPAFQPAGSETHTCFIEFLSAYPKEVSSATDRERMARPFVNLAKTIAPIWIDQLKGRPHWAKIWQQIPNLDVRKLYPAESWTQFNAVRSECDPNGMFVNQFLKDRLFG